MAPEANNIPQWLSPLMVVVGWGIVLINTARYANRSEIRTLCNEIDGLLAETTKQAIQFWIKDGESFSKNEIQNYVYSIDTTIDRLERKILLFSRRAMINTHGLEELVYSLLDSSSMDAEKVQLKDDIERTRKAAEISKATTLLSGQVEDLFNSVAGRSFISFIYLKLIASSIHDIRNIFNGITNHLNKAAKNTNGIILNVVILVIGILLGFTVSNNQDWLNSLTKKLVRQPEVNQETAPDKKQNEKQSLKSENTTNQTNNH